MRGGGVRELARGAKGLAPLFPFLLEHGKPLHQEVREGRPLQQISCRPGGTSPRRRRPSRASSPCSSYSESSNPVAWDDERSINTLSIRSPAARYRRISPRVSNVLTAPAMALRLASKASASSLMLCSRGSQTAR